MDLLNIKLSLEGLKQNLDDNSELLNDVVYGYFNKYSENHDKHQEEIMSEFIHQGAYMRIFEHCYDSVFMRLYELIDKIEETIKEQKNTAQGAD